MNSRKINGITNKTLKEKEKTSVCHILKEEYGKSRKIRRVFYLSEKNKEKRGRS